MNSFKNRLLILIVTLVVLAEGVTIVLALAYLNRGVRAESAQQLMAARLLLDRMLESRAAQLRAGADVLVADFAFREAATSGDRPTIRSALANHARRIDADLAMLYGNDGSIVASTLPEAEHVTLQPAAADTRDAAPLFAVIGARPYQLVFVPLRAPQRIGWVALGFALNESLAKQLGELAGTEVSFVTETPHSESRFIISTFKDAGLQTLIRMLPATMTMNAPSTVSFDGEQYLSLSAPLPARDGRINLIVQRSLDDSLAQFDQMRVALLLIGGVTLIGAIGVAWFAGHSAVQPLDALVAAAEQIERGTYGGVVAVRGGREFEHLTNAFNNMQAGIREREQRIVEQATRDRLTGLANRIAIHDRLQMRPRSDDAFSIALIDVYRFRDLNASVGHDIGDQLLCAIGRRLLQWAGSAEYCARVGVDQFMVGLPLLDSEMQHRVMTLGDEFSRGLTAGGLQLNIEIRAGIAQWRAPQAAVLDLIRQADVALLEAKSRNMRAIVYHPGHDAEHSRRITLVAELRRAIANNELSLAYQPLVLMTTREAAMLEALVRWKHARLGDISPNEFVPLAERASLVGDLSRWVLREAIGQLGRWRRAGLNVEVAVNLSAPDIAEGELPARVLTLLQQHAVPPEQLLLEVTESTIMNEPELAAQVMQRLRSAGVRFAIDDFGTGHSSLAQLHSLPVDELKIDRAFVLNLDHDASNRAIVRSTTELAHILGLRVVAEGVETPEVWSELLRLGCDLAQGYLISRPMPAAQVEEWMRSQRANVARSLSDAEHSGLVTALRPRNDRG